MAPLFVALSIFIKGLPLVYPGRGLMVGRRRRRRRIGVDHAVTFSVLKNAYCCLLPEVLVLKAFWELLRPARLIRGAVKCWQVAPNPYLLVTENMEWLKCRSFKRCHLEAICVADWHCFFWIIALPAPPLIETTLLCCIFPNLAKAERSKREESDWWPPVTTTTVTTVTGSPACSLTRNFLRLRLLGWTGTVLSLGFLWCLMGVLKSAAVHIKANEWIMPSVSIVNEQYSLSLDFNSSRFDLAACFGKHLNNKLVEASW